MKYLTKYRLFESIEPYKFQYIGKERASYIYKFSDGINEFRVEIDRLPDGEAELRYLVKDGESWSFKEVKTNIFKVCETVFGVILRDFINKNEWCSMIVINGLGKESEKESYTQRTKVYWRYLSNNPINGWSIDKYNNEIYIDRN